MWYSYVPSAVADSPRGAVVVVVFVDQIITKATEVEFPAKPQISPKGKAFIKRCLTPHQSERPDVLTVCEDAYLKEKSTK
jgi:hypothetical protein